MAQKLSSIPKKPLGVYAPLSLAQRRLWFIYQLDPQSPQYNISRAWRLTGSLNTQVLETSLNLILARHDALRAIFQEIDGQPIQVIQPTLPAPFQERDCSSYSPAQIETEIDQFLIDEPLQPFNLLTGPLLRFTLMRCGPDDHVLIFTVHHMVFDGSSLKNFCRELSRCYTATLTGQPSPLDSLPIQYQDFSYWQQNHVTDERLGAQLTFWTQQLYGAPFVLELPSDCTRPQDNLCPGGYQTFRIAPQVISNLKQLIQPQGITMFMALLAIFQILLTRYTGQRDILVGAPIAGRTHADLEDLMGFLVNTLVLRTQILGQPTFHEVLRQVRKTCLEAYRHQDLPFEKLVEVLKPVRDPSRHPIIQAIFQLRKKSDQQLSFPEVTAHRFPVKKRTGNFDLHMVCEETESGIDGFLYYPQDLFSDSMMAGFSKHYQILSEKLIANPQQSVTQIPFLTEAECHQQLIDWNDTTTAYPQEVSLPHLFETQVAERPDAVALVSEEAQLTYVQLDQRANQLAQYLQRQGVGPEVRVGVCLERGIDLIVGLLAILKVGGAYVPLDPSYPVERLAYMLADAQAPVLLTQKAVHEQLPTYTGHVLTLQWETLMQESSESPACWTVPENLAYVLYTSGSTGHPKGVMIAQKNVVTFLHWARSVFSPEDLAGVLAATSICFDLSVFELFVPLSWGGTVVLAENALQVMELPAVDRLTLVNGVPSAIGALLDKVVPPAVRTVNLAGEPLKTDLVAAIYRHWGVESVQDLYGPSEATTYATYAIRSETGPATIGHPVANTQGYVVDRYSQLVPMGVPGELYIGGQQVARGYLDRPGMTAEKFVPHPFSQAPGARVYRTGDRARYRSDGNLEFLGRSDHQVKLRGYRIELGEIEAVLSQHPQVQEAVVVCREDKPGDKQLVAYVTKAQNSLEVSEVRAALQAQLPGYMVPGAFIVLERLPLTPNGKVDRRVLPAPGEADRTQGMSYVAPRTSIEQTLATIWQDVLGLEQVGVHDNFFVLGGHSLLATRVVSRVRQEFHVDVKLMDFFKMPTIAELTKGLEGLLWVNAGKPSEDAAELQVREEGVV